MRPPFHAVGRFARTAGTAVLRALCAFAIAAHPRPAERVLIHGRPDAEENALVAALVMTERYRGEVVMLCQDEERTRGALELAARSVGGDPGRVRLVRRRPIIGLSLMVDSRIVLFSLPIYVAPQVRGRRVHVNLWHGTGPKRSSSANLELRIGASALSANNLLWGRTTVEQLHMPADAEILIGNLRQDLLVPVGSRADVLGALGLDPARPLVVWMPTFRTTTRTAVGVMRDAAPLSGSARRLSVLLEEARLAGVQVVTKTHPLDADDYRPLGVPVLDDDALHRAGVVLHQFLALVDGMVSDYSSVWTDFLATRRSVGLFCPDADEYERARGLAEPSLTAVAGGLLLETRADAHEFFSAVAGGAVFRSDRLAAVRDRLGYFDVEERRYRFLEQLAAHADRRHGVAIPLDLDVPVHP